MTECLIDKTRVTSVRPDLRMVFPFVKEATVFSLEQDPRSKLKETAGAFPIVNAPDRLCEKLCYRDHLDLLG